MINTGESLNNLRYLLSSVFWCFGREPQHLHDFLQGPKLEFCSFHTQLLEERAEFHLQCHLGFSPAELQMKSMLINSGWSRGR